MTAAVEEHHTSEVLQLILAKLEKQVCKESQLLVRNTSLANLVTHAPFTFSRVFQTQCFLIMTTSSAGLVGQQFFWLDRWKKFLLLTCLIMRNFYRRLIIAQVMHE